MWVSWQHAGNLADLDKKIQYVRSKTIDYISRRFKFILSYQFNLLSFKFQVLNRLERTVSATVSAMK